MEGKTKEVKLKLTKDQATDKADKRAEELTAQTGKKVYAIVVNTEPHGSEEGDWVIGYIKAPNLYQKAKIIDAFASNNKTMEGINLLRVNLMKEHSDPRLSQYENPDSENIILGAALLITGKAFQFSYAETTENLKKNGELPKIHTN